jgi:predicted phage terminase large subunit-like protein
MTSPLNLSPEEIKKILETKKKIAELKKKKAEIEAEIAPELAKTCYWRYVQLAHAYDKDFQIAKFQKYICDCIDKLLNNELLNDKGKPYIGICLSQPPQTGKALWDETPVFTKDGWKRHGDLIVGDYVFNQYGEPVKVLAVQTSYIHNCVRVEFDNETIICAKEHEWIVWTDRSRKINGQYIGRQKELLEAQHIFDGYQAKNPAVELSKCLIMPEKELPIDPYVLGYWLGNGTSKNGILNCGLSDAHNYERLGNKKDYHNESRITVEGLTTKLRENNLIYNKHIPVEYLTASLEQRKQLFYGLMDSDGYCDTRGRCEYTSINETLASDVATLIRSLGYKVSIIIGDATLNGKVISKKYRVCFSPCKSDKIFTLQRRQNRVDTKPTTDREDKFRHFIKSVKDCGRYSVKCITVEGGIYLAGKNLIQTHNSRCVTETLPSYFLGRNPYKNVIEVSYSDDFANKFGRRNIEKINQYGKQLFGIELSDEKKAAENFEIAKTRGGMLSAGLNGQITGNPADLVIVDDPYKTMAEADSASHKAQIMDVWTSAIKFRVSARCKFIVVHTRWNEDDLIGYLLSTEPDRWFEINLPMIAEEYEPHTGRNIGDPLLPEAGKGKEWVEEQRESFLNDPLGGGTRAWNAGYQQRPSSKEGNLIKREYWQKFKLTLKMQKGEGFDELLQSWDCSFKDTKNSDLVAGGTWGRIGANCFLLDVDYKRMDIIATMQGIEKMSRKWPRALCKLIEDKANGPAVITMLKTKLPGLIPIQATKSKEERVNAVLPVWESGNVFIPDEIEVREGVFVKCQWADEVIDQCANFKPGKKVQKDDLVDMCSQALNRMMYAMNFISKPMPEGYYTPDELKDKGYNPYEIKQIMKKMKKSWES